MPHRRRISSVTGLSLLCCALVFACVPPQSDAQRLPPPDRSAESGLPEIYNYNTTRLGFDAWNKALLRDRRGILYVANLDGVLEFDGEHWRSIQTPDLTPVLSLDLGSDGHIYLGTAGGFGRIQLNSMQQEYIEILSARLPANQQPGGDKYVYETHAVGDSVWFSTSQWLYLWDGRKVRSFESVNPIRQLHVVGNTLYALLQGKGLHTVRGGRFVLVPGGAALNGPEERLAAMLPEVDGGILLVTRDGDWLRYDGTSIRAAWSQDVQAKLPSGINCGTVLLDGTYAVGTARNGIYVIDTAGRVTMVLDEVRGLRDDGVLALYQDHEQTLWAALDNGIAQISWPAPVTYYGRQARLKGRIVAITRFKSGLYVGTTQGIYQLRQGDPRAAEPAARTNQFRPLAGTTMGCSSLYDAGSELIVAGDEGVYAYDGKRMRLLHGAVAARHFFRIGRTRDSILVAFQYGTGMLIRNRGTWRLHTVFPTIAGMVISIERAPDGRIWLGTYGDGAYVVTPKTPFDSSTVERVKLRNGKQELPIQVSVVAGRVRLTNEDATYLVESRTGKIAIDTNGWKELGFPRKTSIIKGMDLPDGSTWLELYSGVRRSCFSLPADNNGRRKTVFILALSNEIVHSVMIDPEGIYWFGTEEKLYRYDTRKLTAPPATRPTLIRGVSLDDSVLYWGNVPSEHKEIVIPYSTAPLSLRFIAPMLGNPELTEYRWKLAGLDNEWSSWVLKGQSAALSSGATSNPTLNYTALAEGSYMFQVQARLVNGDTCQIATIRLRVLPPWQRSWWAYGLYICAAIGLFVLTLHLRTRSLEDRGRQLEQTVRERTEEISTQARKIRTQAEELETLDSIVRTVNKEVHLTDVLSALLQQTLLLFPQVDSAFYLQRSSDDGMFRLVASVGEPMHRLDTQVFTLSQLMDDASNSLQTIQDGVYVLRGLERFWNEPSPSLTFKFKAFMGMSDMQHGSLRGFLVLGSERTHTFSADDLRRLLRLREHVSSAVAKALAIRELETKNQLLDQSNKQLRDMQQQLIVHEKLAALGELTAGIAHEIQNPLNFVNNFSSLSLELLDELEQDLSAITNGEHDALLGLITIVRGNCERIREHGMRATSIVRAMLMHTRKGSGRRETVTLNEFLDQFVLLSYHGMRMLHPEHDLRLHTDYDRGIVGVRLLPQEMSRVIVNICNNAWEAAIEKASREPGTGPPEVHVRSVEDGDRVRITIRDNGEGIPPEMHGRIFEPFFTTKRSGNNAGLGLSMSYEIVTQLHRGRLSVQSEIGQYSEFIIDIPTDDEAAAEE